jgi:hypothetical protein
MMMDPKNRAIREETAMAAILRVKEANVQALD